MLQIWVPINAGLIITPIMVFGTLALRIEA